MALDLSKAQMRRGRITGSDRSFDLEFWRAQSAETKMGAIWEMVVFHHAVKKRDPAELRLDRTVCRFRKKRR
jgi:hypothetical protein